MRILSLNVNKEDIRSIISDVKADIYCFQESRIDLHGARINTVNIYNDKQLTKEDKLSRIWKDIVPWIEFPENYFAECEVKNENINFVLINVHLAGFYNKRFSLMSTLLHRIKSNDIKNKNVIVLGDFNAQGIANTGNKKSIEGANYIKEIENEGFREVFKEGENNPSVTYYDKEIGVRYDHVFFRKGTGDDISVKIDEYYPESTDENKWKSDHRGILISLNKR